MAEICDWDTGKRIDQNVLKGLNCKGCGKPFTDADEEVIDIVFGGGIYAWSWHAACFEATGQPFTEVPEL
jgi:hypothetical protein